MHSEVDQEVNKSINEGGLGKFRAEDKNDKNLGFQAWF